MPSNRKPWTLLLLLGLLLCSCVSRQEFPAQLGDNEETRGTDGLLQDAAGDVSVDSSRNETDARLPADADIQDVCTPDCAGRECGDDGCGGSCGQCGDDNPCTNDYCQAGNCRHDPLSPEQVADFDCICETDEDCKPFDDDDFCNGALFCDKEGEDDEKGICRIDPDTGVECSNDNVCDGLETCETETGNCLDGVPLECDNNNICDGVETCDSILGCQDGTPLECDDGNECTGEDCEPENGCTFTPLTGNGCNDEDPCTEADVCTSGVCAGTTINCDDDVPCTIDSCAATGTCQNVPDSAFCIDETVCNGMEICDPFQGCQDGIPLTCDNNDICDGLETCDSILGCQDGTPLECDDGNECTGEDCDPETGCIQIPIEDGLPCEGGICLGGVCCVIDCVDKECGDDGCGGTCEECNEGLYCIENQCIQVADPDHDRVCPYESCTINATDTCPTVWNPDNDPTICEDLPEGFQATRTVTLTQPGTETGASTWRRTHEPVEVPLWNGIVDDSVVGYWPLDGGEAIDISLYEHDDGMIQNATPVEGCFGEPDGALYFNGQDAWVELPVLNIESPEMTIFARVKADSVGTYQAIVLKHPTGQGSFGLSLAPDGKVIGQIHSGGSNIYMNSVSNTAVVEIGEWTALTIVYYETRIDIYVEGQLVEVSIEFGGDFVGGPPEPNDGNVYLGACEDCSGSEEPNPDMRFHGSIDEVVIFNRALSPTEIAAYYHSHAPYGTNFVPGAQPDFDDLRVTETTPLQEEHQIPFEVIGPRPHSDTSCPMDEDDGTWADREDLCGVVAYWPLDGSLEGVAPGDADVYSEITQTYQIGRFGEPIGSVRPHEGANLTADLSAALTPDMKSLTVEVWVLRDDTIGSHLVVAQNDTCYASGGWGLRLWGEDFGPDAVVQPAPCPAPSVSAFAPKQLSPGVWHHMAGIFQVVGDQVSVDLYVDGLLVASASGPGSVIIPQNVPVRLAVNHAGSALVGKIDEVLIHSVAKSPEYIYRRANPGIPMVRFLASTEVANPGEDEFDWYDYALHWGDSQAIARPPVLTGLDDSKCHGLLSSCLGYAGWWRFNEGSGTVAVDSSVNKNNGTLSPDSSLPVWDNGFEGSALVFDGNEDHVLLPTEVPQADPEGFSVEASVIVHDFVGEWPFAGILTRTKQGGGFYLGLANSEQEAHFVVYDQSDDIWEHCSSAPDLQPNTPCHIAGVLASGELTTFLDLTPTHESIEQAVPGCPSTAPAIGCSASGYDENFHGLIDSVRIMSRALTPDEFLHYPMAGWSLGDQAGCAPDCYGKECGDDGCGGSCGECGTGKACEEGECVCTPTSESMSCKIRDILFNSNELGHHDIWTMNPDGTEKQVLIQSENDKFVPLWSPDGTRFIYAQNTEGINSDIYLVDIGTEIINYVLTIHSCGWLNNEELVCIVFVDGGPYAVKSDLDGNCSSTFISPSVVGQGQLQNWPAPRVSHDLAKIAFAAQPSYNSFGSNIYVINSDGSSDPYTVYGGANCDNYPVWSPDDSRIAWRKENSCCGCASAAIWIADSDGNNPTEIVPNGLSAVPWTFSDNGQSILFSSYVGGQADIQTVDIQTHEINNLTDTQNINEGCPDWRCQLP